ncbi:Alkyl hydroperoxide reductase, thiol specific antioxidant and related enzymes [Phaffia rhodozyma]|uniref:thioredoxin-dependent peroxiredoxin n=1 Tax=Phaffia rhodozyma TaxID=264483 RepID=A0A0F7SKR1_PHARH|nr:Alkyl hydroperoxide reductase, thiol specific antioxidant and related enzymes [Phaffia rhodozyma]
MSSEPATKVVREPTRTSSRLRGIQAQTSDATLTTGTKKRGVNKDQTQPAPSKKSKSESEPAVHPEPAKRTSALSRDKAGTKNKDEIKDKAEKKKEDKEKIGPLDLGQTLSSIILKNEKDEDVDVHTLINDETGLVIFTYPRADTPGCTNQACLYRDSNDEFLALGYTVVGLSKDKPTAQQKWITKHTLNYSLLSDPKADLIGVLGCSNGNSTKRSHFVFEKKTGKLIDKAIGVKPATDSANAIKFIKAHHA